MNKLLLYLILLILSPAFLSAQTVDLSYYLPQSDRYDPSIPAPETILGYRVGDWHASHDQIINYIRAIDAASSRVRLIQYGYTFEHRPLYLLIITSPGNQQNLEQIKAEHLKLSDSAASSTVKTDRLPVFTWLGHSIHGNEASGANAALLLAYHLAAANDPETLLQLEESVIFIDPVINPDGYSRFVQWVNSHKSAVPNDDTQEREHSEPWPGGTIPAEMQAAIREWTAAGNTLIGFESALASFSRAQLLNVEFVQSGHRHAGLYKDFNTASRAQGIAGVILNTRIDPTHPLAWGYKNENLPVFKNSSLIIRPAATPSSTPVAYTEKPLLSGNVLPRIVDTLAGTPVAVLGRLGSGRVIGFAVNPNFRAIWYGTNRLMTNAVFFGQLVNPATLAPPPPSAAAGNSPAAGTAALPGRNE
jgi:hypothetical protein